MIIDIKNKIYKTIFLCFKEVQVVFLLDIGNIYVILSDDIHVLRFNRNNKKNDFLNPECNNAISHSYSR